MACSITKTDLSGQELSAFDEKGKERTIRIADYPVKFRNAKGRRVRVDNDLVTKFRRNHVKQRALAQIDEVIVTSTRTNVTPSTHSHGWLDNNGQNDWETWTTYAVDASANIWKLELSVATSDENIRYLYDVSNIKKAGRAGKLSPLPAGNNVSTYEDEVKRLRKKYNPSGPFALRAPVVLTWDENGV